MEILSDEILSTSLLDQGTVEGMVLPFVLIKQLILFGLLAASGVSSTFLQDGMKHLSVPPGRKTGWLCSLCPPSVPSREGGDPKIFPSFIFNY